MWRLSEEPKRCTKLTAPSRAWAQSSGLLWRKLACITLTNICRTALTVFGSRSRSSATASAPAECNGKMLGSTLLVTANPLMIRVCTCSICCLS